MSYDLTVKSDDDYSQYSEVKPLASFIANLPSIGPNGERGFILDDGSRYMEIDIEVVSGDGNKIDETTPAFEKTNSVALHVPYPMLGDAPEQDYFPTALAIAKHLGWRVFDEQRDEYLNE